MTSALPAARRAGRARLARGLRRAGTHAGLLALTLFSVFPLYYMVTSSLKPPTEIDAIPPTYFPSDVTLDNYRTAMSGPFPTFLANSAKIAILSTALALL